MSNYDYYTSATEVILTNYRYFGDKVSEYAEEWGVYEAKKSVSEYAENFGDVVLTNCKHYSNRVSEYAEEWGVYEAKKWIVNNTYSLAIEVVNYGSHLVNKFPEALTDAIILDGVLFGAMSCLSFSGKVATLGFFGSYVVPFAIVYSIAEISLTISAATIAYDIRKAANEYFGEDNVVANVVVGVFAGAIKYGTIGITLDWKILLIGATNNGLYEYFKSEVGSAIDNGDIIGLYTSVFQIEGTDAILKKVLNDNVNLKSELFTTLNVVTLLSASLWLFLQDKKLSELDISTLERVPNHYNKICNDALGQKCHDYILQALYEKKEDINVEQVCYVNQTNLLKDLCYANEFEKQDGLAFSENKLEDVKIEL